MPSVSFTKVPRSGVATRRMFNAIQRMLLSVITGPSCRHAQFDVELGNSVGVSTKLRYRSSLLNQQNFLRLDSLFQAQVTRGHDDGG
jgi:hypothetical protein